MIIVAVTPATVGRSVGPTPNNSDAISRFRPKAPALIDHHSGQLDELDVEGILAFAERVLPRAADLWVQASLEQRQRFQQLFFPDGIAFGGNGFVRTAVIAPAFSFLRPTEAGNEGLVDQMFTSWNRMADWLTQIYFISAADAPTHARSRL